MRCPAPPSSGENPIYGSNVELTQYGCLLNHASKRLQPQISG